MLNTILSEIRHAGDTDDFRRRIVADSVSQKFRLTLFIQIHGVLQVNDEEIAELSSNIKHFMKLVRDEIVSRQKGHVTPKLHLLELHVVPAMTRLRVGLGLLAEQGSESIHAEYNSLERRFWQIPEPVKWLKAIAMQHLKRTLPRSRPLRRRS